MEATKEAKKVGLFQHDFLKELLYFWKRKSIKHELILVNGKIFTIDEIKSDKITKEFKQPEGSDAVVIDVFDKSEEIKEIKEI